MNIIFMYGASSETTDDLIMSYRNITYGTSYVDTSIYRTGGSSIRINPEVSGPLISPTFITYSSTITEIYVSFSFMIDAVIDYAEETVYDSSRYIMSIEDYRLAGDHFNLYVEGTQLTGYTNNTFAGAGGEVLIGKWNTVEVHFKLSNTAGIVEVKLEGEEIFSFYGDTADYFADYIQNVKFYSFWNDPGYIHFDDIVVTTDAWPGRGGIEALRPVATGTTTELTPNVAKDNYEISAAVPPVDTEYVAGNSGETDTYIMNDPTLSGTVHAVQWAARGRISAPGYTFFRRVFTIDGVEYVGEPRGTDIDYLNMIEIVNLNPATGVAWTTEDLGDIEVGVQIGE